jgi:DNA-binding phage protein
MQQIIGIRDKLRAEIENLDGGYTTVAKLLGQTNGNIIKTLSEDNVPRLKTLEGISKALEQAKKNQALRVAMISA